MKDCPHIHLSECWKRFVASNMIPEFNWRLVRIDTFGAQVSSETWAHLLRSNRSETVSGAILLVLGASRRCADLIKKKS